MKSHIIYIPGLGDHYDAFRRASLNTWRLWGVSAELVPMTWYDSGDFQSKYQRALVAVNNAKKSGKTVYVIGESAGATIAIHLAKNNDTISRTVTLCGVSRRETPVAQSIRKKAPALDHAVNTLPLLDDTVDIVSIRAIHDSVVRPKYSTAIGARSKVIWSIGHFVTIFLALTALAPVVIFITTRGDAHA